MGTEDKINWLEAEEFVEQHANDELTFVKINIEQLRKFRDEFESALQLVEVFIGLPRDQINAIEIAKALGKVLDSNPERLRYITSPKLLKSVAIVEAFMAGICDNSEGS